MCIRDSVSPEVMHQSLDMVKAPVIFSHSSSRGVTDHPRNVPDDVLERMPDNDGVVMVTFVGSFVSQGARAHSKRAREVREELKNKFTDDEERIREEWDAWTRANPAPTASLKDVADHMDRVREIAGIDHLGIGGDYDGTSSLPVGLEDVSLYPDLLVELLSHRGYSEEDLKKITGQNLLRVMRKVEEVAAQLQRDAPPSDLLFEETLPK